MDWVNNNNSLSKRWNACAWTQTCTNAQEAATVTVCLCPPQGRCMFLGVCTLCWSIGQSLLFTMCYSLFSPTCLSLFLFLPQPVIVHLLLFVVARVVVCICLVMLSCFFLCALCISVLHLPPFSLPIYTCPNPVFLVGSLLVVFMLPALVPFCFLVCAQFVASNICFY